MSLYNNYPLCLVKSPVACGYSVGISYSVSVCMVFVVKKIVYVHLSLLMFGWLFVCTEQSYISLFVCFNLCMKCQVG